MRPGVGKTAIIIDAVGNCFRHGVSNTSHEWSLSGVSKRKKSEAASIYVRQCLSCYLCHIPSPVCPYCCDVYIFNPRQLAEEAGELTKFIAEEKKQARMTVGACRTIADLEEIARVRGYARGWIRTQAKLKI